MTLSAFVLQNLKRFSLLLALCAWTPKLQATINVGLSGSAENTSNSLEKSHNNGLSANISFGLGNHVLLGLTHRRSYEHKTGYKKSETGEPNQYVYLPFKDYGESTTNSLDLTIIPYNGLVSPFVFGGVAHRTYENELHFLGNKSISSQVLFPIPNYGFGLSIQLGMGFQLKLTQTFSPGVSTTIENGVEESRVVKDSYSQVWIGYRL